MTPPVEVPATAWRFPPVETADAHGIVGVGADLEPDTLLGAYRHGIFPMPIDKKHIGWWSPDPRGILELEDLRVTRSLRRSCRQMTITVNRCFDTIIRECATQDRSGGWISPEFIAAYQRLHDLGWAHSIETWSGTTLVGGLYGIQIGGLFAGESMFHRERDASKVALVGLVHALTSLGSTLLDVQWKTDHLASLGVIDIARPTYIARLATALETNAGWLGAMDTIDPDETNTATNDREGENVC